MPGPRLPLLCGQGTACITAPWHPTYTISIPTIQHQLCARSAGPFPGPLPTLRCCPSPRLPWNADTQNAALPKKEGTNFAGPFCPAQSQTGRCWRPRANQTKSSASRGMGCSVGAAPTSIAGLLSACVSFIQAWVLRPSSHMLGRPEGQGLPSPGIPKRL